jgi:hypothetical protein
MVRCREALSPNTQKGFISNVVLLHSSTQTVYSYEYMKNYIHIDKIRDVNHLNGRIREAAEQVTRDMLQRVWQGVECRVAICRVTNCAHVETY